MALRQRKKNGSNNKTRNSSVFPMVLKSLSNKLIRIHLLPVHKGKNNSTSPAYDKKLHALLLHSHEAISILDKDINIIYRTPLADQMTGYTNFEERQALTTFAVLAAAFLSTSTKILQ